MMSERLRKLAPALSQQQIGLLCAISSGICVGIMLFSIHMLAGAVSASEVTFLRALSAVLVLLPLALRHGRMWFSKDSHLLWLRSGAGALSVLCLAWNLQHTSVGFANTLFNIAPIVVLLFGYMMSHEKPDAGRIVSILLVVLASAIFWYGSRAHTSAAVWMVGLGGMSAAAFSYALLKSLPAKWTAWDITWCLNLMSLPVALIFKRGPWTLPGTGQGWSFLTAICVLGLLGNALAYASYRYLELSVASAFIPSSIIWGVLLDIDQHGFPPIQGIAGCLLYLAATIRLVVSPKQRTTIQATNTVEPASLSAPQSEGG